MLKFGKKKGDKAPDDGATALAVAHGAEVEGDAPPKKKLPLLFIIIPAALVVLGGGGGAAFFLMQPSAEAAEDGHEAPADHGEAKGGGHGEEKKGGHGEEGAEGEAGATGTITPGPDGVTFYTLPDLVVNIQSADGRPAFLKLRLTLEVSDPAVAYKLQAEYPRLNDMFQGFLRELRPDDLDGSAGSFQLRAEILRRVNLIAAPDKADAVLIEEMLVQ